MNIYYTSKRNKLNKRRQFFGQNRPIIKYSNAFGKKLVELEKESKIPSIREIVPFETL